MATITGNLLNNSLRSNVEADVIDGSGGSDTVDYSASKKAVAVDLTASVQSGGDADGDKLISIENVIGSSFGDKISGDTRDNVLDGGRGLDVLFGGKGSDTLIGGVDGSADRIDGGEGVDTISYAGSNRGLVIDMANGVTTDGTITEDTFKNIENVMGSGGLDTIIGDANANVLNGGAENDVISGGNGADVVIGGMGADMLYGKASGTVFNNDGAVDRFVFNSAAEIGGAQSHDRIRGFEYGVDKIDLSAIDANASLDGDQQFHFSNSFSGFDGTAGALVVTPYASNVGNDFAVGYTISGDLNGDNIADFVLEVYGQRANEIGNLTTNDFTL